MSYSIGISLRASDDDHDEGRVFLGVGYYRDGKYKGCQSGDIYSETDREIREGIRHRLEFLEWDDEKRTHILRREIEKIAIKASYKKSAVLSLGSLSEGESRGLVITDKELSELRRMERIVLEEARRMYPGARIVRDG